VKAIAFLLFPCLRWRPGHAAPPPASPRPQVVDSSPQSLCQYERRTRLNELIHLIGFVGRTVLITSKFALGSLATSWLIIALALNLILGLWPVVLQRYNRLRLYRAVCAHSRLMHRSATKS
jgi:hypothetical protein